MMHCLLLFGIGGNMQLDEANSVGRQETMNGECQIYSAFIGRADFPVLQLWC